MEKAPLRPTDHTDFHILRLLMASWQFRQVHNPGSVYLVSAHAYFFTILKVSLSFVIVSLSYFNPPSGFFKRQTEQGAAANP
jgi:hypothetical protein